MKFDPNVSPPLASANNFLIALSKTQINRVNPVRVVTRHAHVVYEINPPTIAVQSNLIESICPPIHQTHKGLLPYLSINLQEEINNNYRPFSA